MKPDILIVGTLVSIDIIMAEHLLRKGLNAYVVRKGKFEPTMGVPEEYLKNFTEDHLIYVNSSQEFIKLARNSLLILSITGSLIDHLRWFWPFRKLLGLPPIINLTTGSDITELAIPDSSVWKLNKKNIKKLFYRQYLHEVDLNWCLPLPHALKNIELNRLQNVVFMSGFPYIVPKDHGSPADEVSRSASGRFRFFHCSNLDWNYTDFGEQRNSTKGNDKFIRAFIRAVKAGYPIECVMLDRGPDREITKAIFARAGVDDFVQWLPHLSRKELYAEIHKADVIVNMFDHGGAGGISFEAMALGRPVMQYANQTFFDLMYGGSVPPFINCRTEDEIYQKIVWSYETNDLKNLVEEGIDWVRLRIDPENSLNKFLFYYSLLTGKQRLDYGPHIRDTQVHVDLVTSGMYDPFLDL